MAARLNIQALNIEAQREVLAQLLPLAERCWDFVEIMENAGWDAVLPRLNFEASFASEDSEILSEYRQYMVELAKARLVQGGIRFRLPAGKPYDSEFFEVLRFRRDQEIKAHFKSTEVPIWAKAATVCLRRMEFLQYSQRNEFERKCGAVKVQEQERRVYEIARHASGISAMFATELHNPTRFYQSIVEREFGQLKFSVSRERSNNNYVVFSKPLVSGWELCLTPEPLAWYPGRKEGEASIVLTLQSEHHHRSIRTAKWDQVLTIEYAELVPYFNLCYKRFASLDELEIIIMARAFLLSLTIDEIETGLVRGLTKFL